jgi:calpain-7
MYMKAIKLASDAHDRQRLKVKCTEALSAAEEIKRVQEWMSSPVRGNEQSTRAPAGPVAQRPLSTREQLILLEGAKIHGYVFPRWVSDPEDASPPSSAEGDSAT